MSKCLIPIHVYNKYFYCPLIKSLRIPIGINPYNIPIVTLLVATNFSNPNHRALRFISKDGCECCEFIRILPDDAPGRPKQNPYRHTWFVKCLCSTLLRVRLDNTRTSPDIALCHFMSRPKLSSTRPRRTNRKWINLSYRMMWGNRSLGGIYRFWSKYVWKLESCVDM
jgi:hypothetical protein